MDTYPPVLSELRWILTSLKIFMKSSAFLKFKFSKSPIESLEPVVLIKDTVEKSKILPSNPL